MHLYSVKKKKKALQMVELNYTTQTITNKVTQQFCGRFRCVIPAKYW